MAKFDQGGGCPCGLYRTCIEQCVNYVAPETWQVMADSNGGLPPPMKAQMEKGRVVWVVGPKWQTVRECMFFGDEQRARDCAAAMKRFAPDKFRDVAVFAVEVVE